MATGVLCWIGYGAVGIGDWSGGGVSEVLGAKVIG